MSTIQVAMSSQGYRFSHPKGRCEHCNQAANVEGLRCQVGNFWVRPAAGCDRFADRLPAAEVAEVAATTDTRVQIGPLDV